VSLLDVGGISKRMDDSVRGRVILCEKLGESFIGLVSL
jgi:hypothetical protein